MEEEASAQSKYDTDSYSITLFNERGAKLLKVSLGNVGLIRATEVARQKVQGGDAHSFVVERVLMNSMDKTTPWQPRTSPAGRFADGQPVVGA